MALGDIFDEVARRGSKAADIFDAVAGEAPPVSLRSLYETPQPGPTLEERAARIGEPSPDVLALLPKTADLTRVPVSPFTNRYLRPAIATEEERQREGTIGPREVGVGERVAHALGAGAPEGSLVAELTGQRGTRDNMRLFAPEQLMTEAEQARHPILTGAGEFAGGFTSPEGLMLLTLTGGAGQLTGPAGQTVKQLLAAGFTAQMLTEALRTTPEIADAIQRGDTYTAQRLATHAVLGAATAGLAGRGMLPEKAPLFLREGEVSAPLARDVTAARTARQIEALTANKAAREGMARLAEGEKLAEQVPGRTDIFDSVEATAPPETFPKFRSAARANLALRSERGMMPEDRLATLKENRDYLLAQRERIAQASPEERAAHEREFAAVQQEISGIEGKPPLEKFRERPPREPRVPLEQRFPPSVLEEAREEMRAAADMATSMERPGRYFAGVGQTEQGFIRESPKEGIRHGGSWYGVTSMREFVAGQFPWYGKITEGPETLARLVERGKGAAHDRILERIAEGIERERESARPVVEEYAPQLRELAEQVRETDAELAGTLEDLASGRAVGFRDLKGYIEEKIHDAQAAAIFGRAVDEAATKAGEPARFEEPARLGGEARPAEGRGVEEATRQPIRPVEPPDILPGLESAVVEQREAAGRETARQLTEEISRPPESIEAAAGEMERTSPLFRGTEASAQREMFRPGDIFDEAAAEKPKGTTFYSNPLFDPAAWKAAFPTAGEAVRKFARPEITPETPILERAGEVQRGVMREQIGTLARQKEQLFHALKQKQDAWDGRPYQDQLDFILRAQRGEMQVTTADQALASQFQQMFEERRQRIESLEHGAFGRWMEHYFPQLWERPGKVQDWVKSTLLGKRPLEGPKSFTKHRVFADIQQGIDAGFKPLTTNPVTLALTKLFEMDRYVMAHETLGRMKKLGLAKAVMVGQQAPEGWVRLDDRIGTIYGSPQIPLKEAHDYFVWTRLNDLAKSLGIEHKRAVRIGGQRLGYAEKGTPRVVTKFATPESVLAHEIGHKLDWKYGLADLLVKKAPYREELRNLTDLFFEGVPREQVPKSLQREVRKGPEKMARMVEALVHAPEKFQQVAPNTWDFLHKFIADHPELKPLVEARPSLRYEMGQSTVSAGGLVIHGSYYAPAGAARVFNNYLSPGLQKYRLFDTARQIGNTLNQAQLGLSAFHLGFTSLDASVSDMALGLERFSRGDFMRGLTPAMRSLTILGSPVNTFLKGNALLKEYLEPGRYAKLSKLADAVAEAGGRAFMEPLYKNQAIESFWKVWKQGNYGKAGLRAFPAVMEWAAKPVMEYVVPRQKLGVFANLAEDVLRRADREQWTPERRRSELNRAWDSVDNRMGQMVYDAQFWNRAVKDLGLFGVRSLGWNLGTIREIGGGAFDVTRQLARLSVGERAEITHRMAYVMALPIVAGFTGALIHYLSTGKPPESATDYFFPQTGRLDANGRPERLSLPSYVKDIYHWNEDPARTALNKIHPMLTATAQMLENRDYYGTEIRHEDDPFIQRRLEDAEFIAKQFLPFSFRNAYQRAQSLGQEGILAPLKGRALVGTAESFIGLTPAPRSLTETRAEEVAHRLGTRAIPQGPRTKEQFQRSQTLRDYETRYRSGDLTTADLRREVAAHRITGRDAETIVRSARTSPLARDFNHLSLEDALGVWQVASPEERRQLRPLLVRKQAQLENMLPDRRREMTRRLREALTGGIPSAPPTGTPMSLLGNRPADVLGRPPADLFG